MKQSIASLVSGLANQVTRAKHVFAHYSATGGRTMVQATGLRREVLQDVELLLPYGRSALPIGQTADLLILQVNAHRDHKIALACDDPALRIPDLQQGEFGDRDARGQQIVYRLGWIELTALKRVEAIAGDYDLTVGGNANLTVIGNFDLAATGYVALKAATVPSANPPSGTFYLYVDPADGKLKTRGSSGTIGILAIP